MAVKCSLDLADACGDAASTACATLSACHSRRAVAAALDEVRERFELAMRGTHDGVWDWNLQTNAVYYSPRFRELLGVSAESFPDELHSWFAHVHSDDQDAMVTAMRSHLDNHAKYEIELRIRVAGGAYGWFLARGQAVWNALDEPVRMAGSIMDISARKAAEAELVRARNEAELANEKLREAAKSAYELADKAQAAAQAKSVFLATISHELRTPMNAVIGYADLLSNTALSREQKDFAQTISKSAETLLALLNDLLDFSELESGALKVELKEFELQPVIAAAVRATSVLAESHGLCIDVLSKLDSSATAVADPVRVRQILLILLGNAVKFTEKGSITIGVSGVIPPETEAPAYIRVEIADTGVGMTVEQQAKLFSAFAQADPSATRKRGGLGLSLARSKRLIELMGGQIGVVSSPNVGSRFWINLPAGPQRGSHSPKGAGAGASAMPVVVYGTTKPRIAARVLLAEDHPVNQKLAAHVLRDLGCATDLAANGLEAVRRMGLCPSPYDLILMDCQMPEMDGCQAAVEIRRLESLASPRGTAPVHVPIIALTANAMAGDREKCLEAGMDDFLAKPLRSAALQKMLRKWLPGSWPASPPDAGRHD